MVKMKIGDKMARKITKRLTADTAVQEMTIILAVDNIYTAARNSCLDLRKVNGVNAQIEFLTQKLSITPLQAVILAVFISLEYEPFLGVGEMAQYLGCSRLRIMSYNAQFRELANRHFIRYSQREKEYTVVPEALEAFCQNRCYEPESLKGIDVDRLFVEAEKICNEHSYEQTDFEEFVLQLEQLLADNDHLDFVKKLNTYNLNQPDKLFLMWCCIMLVCRGEPNISEYDVCQFFNGGRQRRPYIRFFEDLVNGSNNLVRQGLLIHTCVGGFAATDRFEIAPAVRKNLLDGLILNMSESRYADSLSPHENIVSKTLYYNPAEQQQVARLEELLDEEHFVAVCSRLAEKGLRRGFACLFYGAPGTGKTETAMQIARKTGRDIMQVNVSEMKSKWVGESEKNIKALFDRYREAVQRMDKAPILLFNEADAIFNVRMNNAQHAVDKMDNTIQNIILEEIENLEGILIATTNLEGNMDRAFERRFLYKVRFDIPSVEARKDIWLSMIPELSAEDATILATNNDLNGGEIENIVRKHTVDHIINGTKISLEALQQLCDTERLNRGTRVKIGF